MSKVLPSGNELKKLGIKSESPQLRALSKIFGKRKKRVRRARKARYGQSSKKRYPRMVRRRSPGNEWATIRSRLRRNRPGQAGPTTGGGATQKAGGMFNKTINRDRPRGVRRRGGPSSSLGIRSRRQRRTRSSFRRR